MQTSIAATTPPARLPPSQEVTQTLVPAAAITMNMIIQPVVFNLQSSGNDRHEMVWVHVFARRPQHYTGFIEVRSLQLTVRTHRNWPPVGALNPIRDTITTQEL